MHALGLVAICLDYFLHLKDKQIRQKSDATESCFLMLETVSSHQKSAKQLLSSTTYFWTPLLYFLRTIKKWSKLDPKS